MIRVLGGGELLGKTLAPVLPSEQLDFEFTRLPVVLAAYSVFLKEWPHPTYRALISERDLGRKFFLAEFVVYVGPFWVQIGTPVAAVIMAVHFALGEPRSASTDAESLRRVIDEFEKRNPGIYADVKRWGVSGGFSTSG